MPETPAWRRFIPSPSKSRRFPRKTSLPETTPRAPRPARASKSSTGEGNTPHGLPRATTALAKGCSETASTEITMRRKSFGSVPSTTIASVTLGISRRERPRLIENHRVDAPSLLEAFTSLDEDAVFGPEARAHHDGGRSGQTHGAGAGNDQNGDEIQQGTA